MPTPRYTLFETSIGRCAVAWSDDGVVAVQLPERSVRATRARMSKVVPEAEEGDPSPAASRAIELIRSYLAGTQVDLRDITLDMSAVSDGDRRIYATLRETAPGSRVTYGALARQAGPPATARSVGSAMGRNRFAPVVACHRVVAADGRLGGFSAHGGLETKLRLLAIESSRSTSRASMREVPFDAHAATATLAAQDEVMAGVIETRGPCTLQLMELSPFAALARAIVFQQLHGRAAEAIHARMLALLDAEAGDVDPRALLAATERELRAAGLSLAKIASLRDLAQAALTGVIPTIDEAVDLDDEAIIERVTGVRGIGRWTAQMLLIFVLGRPDVLPVDDFAVRAGVRAAYGRAGLPTPRELEALGRAWVPHRTVASWYLWRVAEGEDSTPAPA